MNTDADIASDHAGDRWLARNRWRAALGVAALEGLLVTFQGSPRWAAITVGLAVLFVYARWGRTTESTVGVLAWIGAMSQALVLLLAGAAFLFGMLVVAAVTALAVGALVLVVLRKG